MEFMILENGSRQVAGTLDLGAAQAEHLMSAFSEIALDMFRIEETVFSSGGRRGGGSWAGLKPDTVKRKGATQILRGTTNYMYGDGPGDYLFESLTKPGAAYNILEFANTEVLFGTERPYAFVHQFGSPARNIPKRPFIRFLPTDVDRWSRMLAAHLMRPFRGSNA